MIGRNGERRSGISVQAARHDDDDSTFFVDVRDVADVVLGRLKTVEKVMVSLVRVRVLPVIVADLGTPAWLSQHFQTGTNGLRTQK